MAPSYMYTRCLVQSRKERSRKDPLSPFFSLGRAGPGRATIASVLSSYLAVHSLWLQLAIGRPGQSQRSGGQRTLGVGTRRARRADRHSTIFFESTRLFPALCLGRRLPSLAKQAKVFLLLPWLASSTASASARLSATPHFQTRERD